MFWHRKKKIEQDEPENVMYSRLVTLRKKIIPMLSNDNILKFGELNCWGIPNYIKIAVETKLGQRYFVLSDDFDNGTYTLVMKNRHDYYDCLLFFTANISPFDDIFEIKAKKNDLKIKPLFSPDKLTAHDIDMAIYELEQIVDKHFESYKTEEEIRKSNQLFHEKEIEKLKRGFYE